jgi:hypothetical protein
MKTRALVNLMGIVSFSLTGSLIAGLGGKARHESPLAEI